MKRIRQDDFLRGAELMIVNAMSDEQIVAAVTEYGYNQKKLAEGKSLYDETMKLYWKYQTEVGEQVQATEEMNKAWDKAEEEFMKILKVSRVALEKNTKAIQNIDLLGARKISINGWINQTESFYQNLKSDGEYLGALAEYNITSERVEKAIQTFNEFKKKNNNQQKEKSEAQLAKLDRDKKMDELSDWISKFRKIARVAFHDKPQALEKLGVMVLNEPRKLIKDEEVPETPEA